MAENNNNTTKKPSQPTQQPTQKQDRSSTYAQDSKRSIQEGHVVTSTMPAPKPKVTGK